MQRHTSAMRRKMNGVDVIGIWERKIYILYILLTRAAFQPLDDKIIIKTSYTLEFLFSCI